jgi:hypothetical protein
MMERLNQDRGEFFYSFRLELRVCDPLGASVVP